MPDKPDKPDKFLSPVLNLCVIPESEMCRRNLYLPAVRKLCIGTENQGHGWIPGEKYVRFGVLYVKIV